MQGLKLSMEVISLHLLKVSCDRPLQPLLTPSQASHISGLAKGPCDTRGMGHLTAQPCPRLTKGTGKPAVADEELAEPAAALPEGGKAEGGI